MAYRIAAGQKDPLPSMSSRRIERKSYLDFVRELPCLITGKQPVEAAHLSTASREYGNLGRGKGRRVSDRWCLPLCPEEHRRQHLIREPEYWCQVGINPYVVALGLFGLWSDYGEDAMPYAVMLINWHRTGR